MLRKQWITIAKAVPQTTGFETRTQYTTRTDHIASIYPLTDGVSVQMYGLRSDDTRLLILHYTAEIGELDGVWLPGENLDSGPVWEAFSVTEHLRHKSVTIRKRVTIGG